MHINIYIFFNILRMTRILYIPKEIEYDHLQRVKLIVLDHGNSTQRVPRYEHEFCVECHRTTYLFLMNFIVSRTKISAHCFSIKLNGWNEIYNLYEKYLTEEF